MNQPVFLLDIDGVLVNPGGYRKATQATLDWFTRRMGIASVTLTEEILSQFEAQNISSEFDIVPLCLAEIFDELLALYPKLQLPGDLNQACDQVCAAGVILPQVDFIAMAARVSRAFRSGGFPSEVALEANQVGSSEPPFPHLRSHPLLEIILNHTRDVRLSPVTRLFQQFVLGSEAYQVSYGLPAEFETDSLLRAFDRPLLDRELAESLKEFWVSGKLDLVAYTGRPSALCDGTINPLLPYSPEANLALEVVGLTGIPLVGLGQTYRLAELTGGIPDELGKPSLISALGAIGAAVTRDGLTALLAAESWITRGESGFFERLPALDIHLFEDTAGSIGFTHQAAEMLVDLGISTHFHAWGIACTATKIAALQAAGAEIREDINFGIRAAMKTK